MSNKELFTQKMETQVARAQADLARYSALGMGLTATAKNNHDAHVEEFEQKLDETKAKLRKLSETQEQVWEDMRDVVMIAWGALQSSLQEAIENFKAEPKAAGLHDDEGDYPYGEGLSGRRTSKTKIEKGV